MGLEVFDAHAEFMKTAEQAWKIRAGMSNVKNPSDRVRRNMAVANRLEREFRLLAKIAARLREREAAMLGHRVEGGTREEITASANRNRDLADEVSIDLESLFVKGRSVCDLLTVITADVFRLNLDSFTVLAREWDKLAVSDNQWTEYKLVVGSEVRWLGSVFSLFRNNGIVHSPAAHGLLQVSVCATEGARMISQLDSVTRVARGGVANAFWPRVKAFLPASAHEPNDPGKLAGMVSGHLDILPTALQDDARTFVKQIGVVSPTARDTEMRILCFGAATVSLGLKNIDRLMTESP